MKIHNDILPLIGAVSLAVVVLQASAHESSVIPRSGITHPDEEDVDRVDGTVQLQPHLAGVGVDISRAHLAAIFIGRLAGKGVDIS
jgi:hypothetical protein